MHVFDEEMDRATEAKRTWMYLAAQGSERRVKTLTVDIKRIEHLSDELVQFEARDYGDTKFCFLLRKENLVAQSLLVLMSRVKIQIWRNTLRESNHIFYIKSVSPIPESWWSKGFWSRSANHTPQRQSEEGVLREVEEGRPQDSDAEGNVIGSDCNGCDYCAACGDNDDELPYFKLVSNRRV